mgnify:CR=1 FL=1
MNIYLKGNYKSFIKLDVFKTKKKTNKVYLNVHGLYVMSGDRGSKSKFLGNRILEKNIANVVQFSSSRDWTIFPTDGAYYSKQQESFKGELLFLQVSLDGVVSIEAQNKLFYNFKKAKKQKVIIEGANHNFS